MFENVITSPYAEMNSLSGGLFSSNQVAARLLANNLDLQCLRPVRDKNDNLRTFAILAADEWEEIDRMVVEAYHDKLNAVQDLIDRGLTHNLGNIGVSLSSYVKASEANAAQMSMFASVDMQASQVLQTRASVPVPVFFSDFSLDIRTIQASRAFGGSIDLTSAREAARAVAEKVEQTLFDGNTTVMGGTPIYGYRTHPDRNTSSGSSWGTASNILPNISTMAAGIRGDNRMGPYVLYLHSDQYAETLVTTGANTDRTWRQIALEAIPELVDIKWVSKMTAGEAVMVSLEEGTVDYAIAEEFMPVEWEGMGGLSFNMRNMTVAVPRVKSDHSGRSGVYHMTGI